ncbi:SF1B family DNA helicase RecD2 [Amphibacillus sediminis]|uniref:SF1B family DNA helicase RecD2 n=1 Tax=Amphibacillus sediminis TaxID=360185 RepID=UPI0008339414|nr:ATP-dependent RecD-like DNA helicase [Amphibacillus sediminis]
MENQLIIEDEKYIKGELIYMIYSNQAEHFSIAKIKVLETNESFAEPELVVKGYFSELLPGEAYLFNGEFVEHKKFGLQYEVSHFKRYLPNTREGLIAYLSSDLFHGIGKRTATRIVDQLGEGAVSKILDQPDLLDHIQGITKERKEALINSLKEHQGFDHVVVHLSKYGIGLKMAQKIYQTYQDQALDILMNNPYQYVFDIEGFGFHRADSIASQNEIAHDHPARLRAAFLYILYDAMQEGHVFLPDTILLERSRSLLESNQQPINPELLKGQLIEMEEEQYLIVDEDRIYLPVLFYAEVGFCSNLKRLLMEEHEQEVVEAELLKIVGKIEEEEVLSYGKEQYQAIEQALSEKVMILTGGPGTGKTTVIKGILRAYSASHELSLNIADYNSKAEFPFVLTAPTGRAAKRLSESTGLPAVTIHRLLGWDGHESFEKNKENPLNGRFLVVDEFSMVDIFLANQLFKAIPNGMQVLLVGDEDQLPSVGPGQVLADLLASQQVKCVQLNEVYRQKEGSKIIQLAHHIKHNRLTQQDLEKASDFNFIRSHRSSLVGVVKQIAQKAIDKGFELKDIQILAPMYKTEVGIHQINQALQAVVNPKRKGVRELRFKETVFRTGDKVIQLVNQPEDGVFNGDIGQITAIFKETENVDQEEQVVVTYDDNDVIYTRKDLFNIMHAYCISIHKSQGSEFPIIILPIDSSFRRMLRKNLLYTAVTRAKQSLIICGDIQAFLEGVKTEDTNMRYTSLINRLTKIISDEHYAETIELAVNNQEELSPFDFL